MVILYLNLESRLCMNTSNLFRIRTHPNKVCSVWSLNLNWDVVVFLNFFFAIFLEIRFVFRLNMYAFSVLLQMCSNFGHWVTSLNVGRRQLVRFSGKTIYYCQEYRLDTLNFKGDQSEYSNYFVLFFGDLLWSVPYIKTDVKINLQEYIDHSGWYD